jgi:hypothetical protein
MSPWRKMPAKNTCRLETIQVGRVERPSDAGGRGSETLKKEGNAELRLAIREKIARHTRRNSRC